MVIAALILSFICARIRAIINSRGRHSKIVALLWLKEDVFSMRQSGDIMHATSGRQFATSYHGARRRSLEPMVIVRTSSAVVLLRANLQCVRTNMPELLHVIGSVG